MLNQRKHTYIGLFLFALILLFEILVRTEGRLAHDFSSYVIPASGLGTPYSDYFINRPPFLFLVLRTWGMVFGYSILSWRFLEIILLFAVLYGTFAITVKRKLNVFSIFLLTLFSFSFLFGQNLTMFLPVELIGLSFILAAITLMRKTKSLWAVALSYILLVLAAGVREQYLILIPIVLIPQFVPPLKIDQCRNHLKGTLIGLLSPVIFLLFYFLINGNFKNFLNVSYVSIQSEKRSLNQYFQWFRQVVDHVQLEFMSNLINSVLPSVFLSTIVTVVIVISPFFILNAKVRSEIGGNENSQQNLRVFIVGIALLISTAWQSAGYRYSGHYAINSTIGVILIISSAWSLINEHFLSRQNNSVTQKLSRGLALLLLASFIPSHLTLNRAESFVQIDSLERAFDKMLVGKDEDLTMNEKITRNILSRAEKDFDCAVNVYGWDQSFYLYTQSRPCTRFFIPNLVVTPSMNEEYRKELLENPPRVINYRFGGADLDVGAFERNVFPFSLVLSNCYANIPIDSDVNSYRLYKSIFKTAELQRQCLKEVLQVAGQN